tara:strand:+ start:137 stop:442 length:306 start_codon:yes stop_codon:yes gene_type:complete
MALTGELTYKGLTISNAYVRVTRVFHSSDFDPDSNAKVLKADYSAKVYKDASTCASSPLEEITIVTGTFTPSVGNEVNLNIVKQTYEHIKTLSDYSSLSDV